MARRAGLELGFPRGGSCAGGGRATEVAQTLRLLVRCSGNRLRGGGSRSRRRWAFSGEKTGTGAPAGLGGGPWPRISTRPATIGASASAPPYANCLADLLDQWFGKRPIIVPATLARCFYSVSGLDRLRIVERSQLAFTIARRDKEFRFVHTASTEINVARRDHCDGGSEYQPWSQSGSGDSVELPYESQTRAACALRRDGGRSS